MALALIFSCLQFRILESSRAVPSKIAIPKRAGLEKHILRVHLDGIWQPWEDDFPLQRFISGLSHYHGQVAGLSLYDVIIIVYRTVTEKEYRPNIYHVPLPFHPRSAQAPREAPKPFLAEAPGTASPVTTSRRPTRPGVPRCSVHSACPGPGFNRIFRAWLLFI